MEDLNPNRGGVYVHVPFCKHKCLYCDFYTGGHRIADWDRFANCLINELKIRRDEVDFPPFSLYLGGGTPSLLPPKQLEKLIYAIQDILGVNHWEEFTIEANPDDITHDLIHVWKNLGVNRVSLGVQSLNNNELKTIGRIHDAASALSSLSLLQSCFRNVSVDVIFGLPGQTPLSYRETLQGILNMKPTHLSAYSLMLEEGTALSLLARQNKINLPSEDEWLQMFDLTNEITALNGYIRYEISNYALPGLESRHNSLYWAGSPYLGLGPGAHSFNGKEIRRANPNDIKGYMNFFDHPSPSHKQFFIEENLSEEEMREEMIMTRLRTLKGLDLEMFGMAFGDTHKEILLQKASRFLSSGLMKEDSGFLSLTPRGFNIYNSILSGII